ncbi:MAG: PD40 domain-containing protein [Phycisphaerae bacterium]|nr:PD40 domain-containing protein [Phycisphaerae bacterium]
MNRLSIIAAFFALVFFAGQNALAQSGYDLFQKGLVQENVNGDLDEAIRLYKQIVEDHTDERPLVAKALVQIGLCYEKLGTTEARTAYERVVREYADQPESSKVARERLSAITGGASGATGRTEVAMRRIWAAGRDAPLSISPDGRYVVFSASDNSDLWLRDIQSGEQKRITREASLVDWTFPGKVAISPDGKQIVYFWWVRSYGELRLSALDGSSMKVLHSGQEGRSMYPLAWMPDGHQILAVSFNRKDNNYRRQIISLQDGVIRDIGQLDRQYMDWSYPNQDGQYIAYNQNGDIFIYHTETEKDSVLIKSPSNDKMIGWTPDGFGILFMSDRSGTFDLYILRIENGRPLGEPKLLRKDIGTNKKLYLTRDGQLFRIENTSTSNSFIINVDEQTGKLTGTPSPVDAAYPGASWSAWSPDGKLLYYSMSKGPSDNRTQVLVIRSEVTGETRELTSKPKLPWYRPILSPDGRRFAVTGTGENRNFGVFAIDSESGVVSQLAKIPTENEPVDPSQNWSPDGKAIFYKVRSLEKSEEFIIRRKDLTTGEEKDVHRGIHTRDMKISPDGTRFVYFRNDRPTKSYVLGILDLQSGKELELWRVPEADSPDISGPTWAPDGRHVLVAKSLKQGSELWRFPAAGGPGEKLHFSPESTWGFVMHPSGKRMAFTQSRTNYELWVLENFLPEYTAGE